MNGHSPWSVFCCKVCLQRFNVSALLLISTGVICCTSFFFSFQRYIVCVHALLSPMSMTMTDHPRQWLKKTSIFIWSLVTCPPFTIVCGPSGRSIIHYQERSSLQQALKRAQQQTVLPPVDQRIADCAQFIERAKKRVQIAEADVKKAVEAQSLREGELAVAEQRLVDLQQEAARAEAVPSTISTSTSNSSGGLVAHRGRQIQGTCESTSEGFDRSSPDCASGGGETPRRVDGRHAHRRTESEVLVGGQESGDARCSGLRAIQRQYLCWGR